MKKSYIIGIAGGVRGVNAEDVALVRIDRRENASGRVGVQFFRFPVFGTDERDGEVIRGGGVDLTVGDRLLQNLNRGVGVAGAVKRPAERREVIAVVRLLLDVARRVLNGSFALLDVVLFAEREREPGDRFGVERILTDDFLERRLGLRIVGAEERDLAVNL